MNKLTAENRVALLMHDAVGKPSGKMGYGLLRYGSAPVVAIIDKEAAGQRLHRLTGIPVSVPIVRSVREAFAYSPDVLIPAIAPSGGTLPEEWVKEIQEALKFGLSVVNGLHTAMGTDQRLSALVHRPKQFIWDVRQEPEGITPGAGRAVEVPAKRVLFVGTDMNNGKMTAALEMNQSMLSCGIRSKFLATGQTGIMIAGEGIPLDAIRVDFASGAVEQMVLRHGNDNQILFIEGQGSLLHPASTATLPLLRGSMPTHLILVHRAGQTHIVRTPWVPIPSLSRVIRLYEALASAEGSFPPAKVIGIALNTAHLGNDDAIDAIERVREEAEDLPVTDVVRYDSAPLLETLINS